MIRVFRTVGELAEAAARRFVDAAVQSVEERGRFVVALSGGHSPRPLYQLLTQPAYRDRIPWEKTIVFWSDERYVPLNDERSNAGTAKSLLLDQVPVRRQHVHTVYDDAADPTVVAARYEHLICELFEGSEPRLDLTLLGCGEDGHTASLFPGSPMLNESDKLVAAVEPSSGDMWRITMTPPLLTASRSILFLAHGESKADIVRRVLEGPDQGAKLPAQQIRATDGSTTWMLDAESASRLAQVSSS